MYLIGDRLTVTGLQLAGLKKSYICDKDNVKKTLDDVRQKAKIILITQELAKHVERDIEKIREAGDILIEIPDRHGGGELIMEKMIKEALGFDLKK